MRFRFVGPLLLYLLVVSVLLLADMYSLLVFSQEYGLYLAIGTAGLGSLLGVLLAVALLAHRLRLLRRSVYRSESPWRHYRNALALFSGGILFLPPGAVSSALGLVCLLPVIREVPGWILTALMRNELEPVYDYLKMEEPVGKDPLQRARAEPESQNRPPSASAEDTPDAENDQPQP